MWTMTVTAAFSLSIASMNEPLVKVKTLPNFGLQQNDAVKSDGCADKITPSEVE